MGQAEAVVGMAIHISGLIPADGERSIIKYDTTPTVKNCNFIVELESMLKLDWGPEATEEGLTRTAAALLLAAGFTTWGAALGNAIKERVRKFESGKLWIVDVETINSWVLSEQVPS